LSLLELDRLNIIVLAFCYIDKGVSVMFNKYNDRARQALMYAHGEAKRFRHGYVGTEHVLLGIVEDQDIK